VAGAGAGLGRRHEEGEKGLSDRELGKADLHVHTALGDGMASPREILEYVETHTDLDVIAITDHDSLRGAWETRELWAQGSYRFQVVMGMEVTALEGHLLALFIEEPLPSLRPAEEIIAAIHRQGGLCIVPHPFSWLTRSLGRRALERLLASGREGVYLDGLETANASPGAKPGQRPARELNQRRYHLAEVGGSDAHFLAAIGSAYTLFPGRTAEELRQAILERRTRGVNGRHPTLWELGLGQVLRQSWRGLTVTPRTVGLWPTARSFMKRLFPWAPM
jgi:predicted metal-dependent phosphoesterase TrpH